jgi:hypothetical protein
MFCCRFTLLLSDWQVKGRFKKDIYRDEFEPSNRFPHLTLTLFCFFKGGGARVVFRVYFLADEVES